MLRVTWGTRLGRKPLAACRPERMWPWQATAGCRDTHFGDFRRIHPELLTRSGPPIQSTTAMSTSEQDQPALLKGLRLAFECVLALVGRARRALAAAGERFRGQKHSSQRTRDDLLLLLFSSHRVSWAMSPDLAGHLRVRRLLRVLFAGAGSDDDAHGAAA